MTLRQIDEVHGRPAQAAWKQFNRHRHRNVEGVDFFQVQIAEIRLSEPNLPEARQNRPVILLTERGYGKVCKGWNDDRSWALHDAYFTLKGNTTLARTGGEHRRRSLFPQY